ncbi:MAG: FAD-binding oxidoreductase [Magnetovibrionaceae bacterium]
MPLDSSLLDAIRAVVGDKGLLTGADDIAPYLEEERGKYRGSADLVVRPANTQQVAEVVKLAHEARVPLVPQGGNTGLCGGGVPAGGIVLSLARMKAVRAVDPINHTMTVEAGVILADVQAVAEEAGGLFPLSLGAEGSCQIGGNLATNAGGTAVLRYGNTRDLVLGLEVVLADGRIWDGLTGLRKNNTGYDLKDLFVGSEGTLGIITAAVLKIFPKPAARCTAMAAGPDVNAMMDLFARMMDRCGDVMSGFEFTERFGLSLACQHVDGCSDPFEGEHGAYALIELTSPNPKAAEGLQERLEDVLGEAFEAEMIEDAVIAANESQADALWHIRESIPEAQKHEGGSIKHDISVPVSSVAEFMKRAAPLVENCIPGVRICAFGHMGDGNIHYNLTQPAEADREAFLGQWEEVNQVVHDLVHEMKGSFSAEHGVGKLKTSDMNRYKSAVELDLMARVKQALDPEGLLNPGKVINLAED